MRSFLILILGACITLLSTSCATVDTKRPFVSPIIDKLAAISLANGAVLKRGLPLDRSYVARARDSVYASKGGPQYPAYCVSFYKKPGHSPIYVVYVRKTDGDIAQVSDFTKTYLTQPTR